jgi:putative transposase
VHQTGLCGGDRQTNNATDLPTLDRVLWISLYRTWPLCQNFMLLVKQATVVQLHRQGYRLYWRWRQGPDGRHIDRGVRDLIRQMNKANTLRGAAA